jgi:hypothetical protein
MLWSIVHMARMSKVKTFLTKSCNHKWSNALWPVASTRKSSTENLEVSQVIRETFKIFLARFQTQESLENTTNPWYRLQKRAWGPSIWHRIALYKANQANFVRSESAQYFLVISNQTSESIENTSLKAVKRGYVLLHPRHASALPGYVIFSL